MLWPKISHIFEMGRPTNERQTWYTDGARRPRLTSAPWPPSWELRLDRDVTVWFFPALNNIFYTPMARYNLSMLKLTLNTYRPTTSHESVMLTRDKRHYHLLVCWLLPHYERMWPHRNLEQHFLEKITVQTFVQD